MKVLVTGGAGYIGSHTVKALEDTGHQVILFDNLSNGNDHVTHSSLFKGDLRNKADLEKIFSQTKFDAVIHFAARIEVKESTENPGLYYENNVLGAINLLEVMRKHAVKTIVFSSTAAVYGNAAQTPLREDTQLNPINPYGRSKLMVENILRDYHSAYGFSTVTLRYFNAAGASIDGSIGETHTPETHLIPRIISQALQDLPITIFGNDYPTPDGTAVRDYVHVIDLARAHVLSLEHANFENISEVFNLGSGTGYSIKQVIEVAQKVLEKPIKVEHGPRREGDPAILVAATEKIQNKLGWKAEYSSLETIIQTAYHWHKKQSHHKK